MSGICLLATFDGSVIDERHAAVMPAAAGHRGERVQAHHGDGASLLSQRAPYDVEGDPGLARAGGLTILADARIDNGPELVPHLVRYGYLGEGERVTSSELILASFRLWGDSCPRALIGDFAFVIWNAHLRRVFAARDPMGMRPLYLWSRDRRRIALASEIKQLLALPDVPCRIFEPAIATTLAGPHTPASWTTYAGIQQLPPAGALVADQFGLRTVVAWEPSSTPRGDVDEVDAAELFRSTFADAVRSRVARPHTVGIFLSGGTDSGSVASMAGHLREQRPDRVGELRSYSWAFDELVSSDEREVSNHIVSRYDLAATDVLADELWPLAEYPAHAPDRDDPYTWVYQALIERTLERCREDGVTLQIVADRGDELTGDWVYDDLGLLRAGKLSAALIDIRLAADEPNMASTLLALRRRVLRPLIDARWPAMGQLIARRRAGQAPWPPWVRAEFAERVGLADIIADALRPPSFGDAARRQRHQRVFLPQAARIAVLRNRTRAQYGMQFADPYSDRRLVELVLGLPQWLVQRRGQPKHLARAAMEGIMPEMALRQSRKTIPFELFDRGFRDRAAEVVDDLLRAPIAASVGWLDGDAARAVYHDYRRTGGANHDFWWPLTVEMWLRRWWVDGAGR